jgi:hypothetical protein
MHDQVNCRAEIAQSPRNFGPDRDMVADVSLHPRTIAASDYWARNVTFHPISANGPASIVCLADDDASLLAICNCQGRRTPMLRNAIVGLGAALLVGVTFIPDDALAYRGGGARVGGGGVRVAGVRGGAVGVAGRGVAYRGGAYRGAAYRGAGYRGGYYPYRGAAIGAAAVGAAAAGAAAYGYYNNSYGYYGGGYNNGCYQDPYGNWICRQY